MNSPEPDPNEKPQEKPANGVPPEAKAAPGEAASAEVVEDLDAYQRRIEREWERARAHYQTRLAGIMEDVLKKGTGPAENGSASEPAKGPHTGDPADLLGRMADGLRAMEAATRGVPLLAAPKGFSRRGRFRQIAFIAAVAALGAAAVALANLRIAAWTPLPYARTGAIAVLDGKIYVADWFRKTLYIHAARRGAPILSVQPLPVGLVAGMSPDDAGLWTVDGLSGEIVRHSAGADRMVVERYPAPDAKPAAIARDGTDLWLAGLQGRVLFRLRSDDPSEVKERFDLPLENVAALQIKDKRLWALDGKSREVTVFRLQKPLKALATFDLDPFLNGGSPTGLALAGNAAWIVTENPSAIVRLPIARLKKSKSSDF